MRERESETNSNYELVIRDVTTRFFPSKELQIQKRYPHRGLYKPTTPRYAISYVG